MIRINPFFCAKDLTISEGTGVPSLFHFHSRVLMSFHAPLRPRKIDKTINYFIYEFHSNRNTCLPKQNFELAILLPSRQRFASVEKMIHSHEDESPTPLHCQNACCIFERGWPPCFSHGTILFPPSPLSPRSTETKCRTGANSSSRKKGLTEPG